MVTTLLSIYLPLLGWTLVGILIWRWSPPPVLDAIGPQRLGRFMYWVGVPISIVGFSRGIDLSGPIWIAPIACWVAVLSSGALARGWIRLRSTLTGGAETAFNRSQRGSLQLVTMLGNTGYVGYPICLAIGGTDFFAWALFYDLLGTLFCAYGLGVWVASRHSHYQSHPWQWIRNISRSPALWAFAVGLSVSQMEWPVVADQLIKGLAWAMIPLSLTILGMRLAQMKQLENWGSAGVALLIKLVLIPGGVGLILSLFAIPPTGRLLVVLQSSMPPALASLVLAEEYDLDRDITVTTLALGYLSALLTLPLWAQVWGSR